MEEGLKFFDAVDVDDGGTVDADEFFGGEARFDGGHGFAKHVGIGADVKNDVVVSGFDPIDVFVFEEQDAALRFDNEAIGGRDL